MTLIAVTKTVDAATIREAVALGLRDLGENRVQEAQEKRLAVGNGVRWHLVGHLQRNKAKHAVELFDTIHSVDTPELVEALDRQAAQRGRTPDVLIQVNIAGEATKNGCRVDEARTLAQAVRHATHLRLTGLMTIAPLADDPEAVRPVFRRMRELRDQLGASDRMLRLSMGMSHDFEVAIEEGADLIRVGTAIFGARAA